jgi:Putative esterase
MLILIQRRTLISCAHGPSPALARAVLTALALLALITSPARAARLAFEVSFTPAVRATPFTGRILVFTAPVEGPEPRFGPDWFQPHPFYGLDVRDLRPGQSVVLDERALGFPAPPGEFPETPTRFQAVLDQNPDESRIGSAAGNGVSDAVRGEPGDGPVRLVIDRLLPARPFPESDRVKGVEIPSPRLTRFHHRPVRLRAGVVLPEGYTEEATRRFPVIYMIPGFGGDHFEALRLGRDWPELTAQGGPEALIVVLDPTAYTGHHVFADSANNGPVGEALVRELIPHIDRTFRTVARPEARLLTGHSSGGWSSLWLQCTYPDVFGGVWSTSPDPVDFRDFQQMDLYAPGANLFTDAQGKPRPLARQEDTPVLFFKPFSDMETVLGHGGQLQSFEAVFSPRGADGRPRPLYDRATGAVDPGVARAWGKYDINRLLTQNWKRLGPKLAGKLHVYTGEKDTFYLEGAARLLQRSLASLGSDAVVEIVPGKDHGTLLGDDMRARIAREMAETLRRVGISGRTCSLTPLPAARASSSTLDTTAPPRGSRYSRAASPASDTARNSPDARRSCGKT